MRSITLFIATVLLTSGLLGVPTAQSTPSTGTGDTGIQIFSTLSLTDGATGYLRP